MRVIGVDKSHVTLMVDDGEFRRRAALDFKTARLTVDRQKRFLSTAHPIIEAVAPAVKYLGALSRSIGPN
jgi:hypothetical protein